jgi:hypothetical protein
MLFIVLCKRQVPRTDSQCQLETYVEWAITLKNVA